MNVDIRNLESAADLDECLSLQRQTWGDSFAEAVPPVILRISQKVGGVVAGAFDETGRMLGFVFGISGVRAGRLAHWSHMLAVVPEKRDQGIGRMLKQFQRDQLVARGIEVMYWTFDPLVARNAHLNLDVLGAEVDEYATDMYGPPGRNTLDAVIGTDRFIVRWELVRKSREFRIPPEGPAFPALSAAGLRFQSPPATADLALIEVPADIHELKQADPARALAWRMATREAFTLLLGAGWSISGTERSDGHMYYRVTRLRKA